MTRTIVASATREIIIGFDQPFCVIGERINPTGRKKLAAEMIEGNFETVIKDALEQAAAGATMLDVNAGVTAVDPNATEPALLVQTLEIVQGLVDLPLSIDSSVTGGSTRRRCPPRFRAMARTSAVRSSSLRKAGGTSRVGMASAASAATCAAVSRSFNQPWR